MNHPSDTVRQPPRPSEVPPVSNGQPGTKGAGPVGVPDADLPKVVNPKKPWKG